MITEAQNGRGSKFLPEKASTQMVSDQLKAGSGLRKYLLVDDNDINLRVSPQDPSASSTHAAHQNKDSTVSGQCMEAKLLSATDFILVLQTANNTRFLPPS